MPVEVQGDFTLQFERVADAFKANFEHHGEVGAAFSLYVEGEKVVDIWGGIANEDTGAVWNEDTLALFFSTTKGVAAICLHLLAQRGEVDLDAPVADYWPEFKAAGKESIPVRWLLSHRAGVVAFDERPAPDEVYAWDPIITRLEAQAPFWEPGTAHGYHALTYGWLVGEVLRRVTGRSIGQFFRTELAEPLGLDTWIGLPEAEEKRVARLVEMAPMGSDMPKEVLESLPEGIRAMVEAFADPESLSQRALSITNPPLDFNSRAVHAAEIPAANGISTARSLAKLYATTVSEVDGIRTLTPETVADATVELSDGPDRVLMVPTRFGSGFFLSSAFSPLYGPGSFGHAGAGGSLGFADPDAKIGFGYIMNKMQANLAGDPRTLGLIEAVRQSLS